MNNIQEDSEGGKKKKKPSSRADIVKRMVAAHRKRKREEKIDKLQSRSDLWKGLEWISITKHHKQQLCALYEDYLFIKGSISLIYNQLLLGSSLLKAKNNFAIPLI